MSYDNFDLDQQARVRDHALELALEWAKLQTGHDVSAAGVVEAAALFDNFLSQPARVAAAIDNVHITDEEVASLYP